jgi:predicted PhzF superfamily epimerase YddE/YHI9
MITDVNELQVFTDADGKFGNPLGVISISAATVPAGRRRRIAAELGYNETVFIDSPIPGHVTAHAQIFTPTAELLFAGHAVVGAAWWLRRRGTPIRSLQLRAGVVEVDYAGDLAVVQAFAQWTPEFAIHDLGAPQDVIDADPEDYSDGFAHCLWAWIDESAGHIRSRAFAPELGVQEDEVTGCAAIRVTDYLSRDLIITQGRGSVIHTWWSPRGWVGIGGRVVSDWLSPMT